MKGKADKSCSRPLAACHVYLPIETPPCGLSNTGCGYAKKDTAGFARRVVYVLPFRAALFSRAGSYPAESA